MSIDIEKLGLAGLLDLNRRIIRRVEYLHSLKTRAHLDRFEVGDRVSRGPGPNSPRTCGTS
ncbi:MAG: hypothetical protein HZB91_14415 [Elusimicrobia bacterium]|nr:hypothetical protein [Elusimicrobiota bacterium]